MYLQGKAQSPDKIENFELTPQALKGKNLYQLKINKVKKRKCVRKAGIYLISRITM